MSTIVQVETFIRNVPTIRRHVPAMATMHHPSIVLVRTRDADGIEGLGDGTTIGGLSYDEESPEGIKLAIDTYITPILLESDASRVAETMARIGRSVAGNHIAK
ncbi:hypothetical protein [Methylobacterium brachythecii]|uniref:L-alanine-DL-glutamate epimerase-like enolase superfamily enzyme n=1 Tax=Methylobacterium brachythecii TaxID=1176177 RepID=A0A7W6ALK6_9HYPH|nr:hypothetical protein [Methylobacterium brachythecii]MBB3903969.1 L-alanine-DL-glutamate epimerase-like enolase superfamily enzyme [Methylobacterium brachythecii]GLS42713.1 hypothetical protein GCM10007884_06980 [Methylobacterium brachythecii]